MTPEQYEARIAELEARVKELSTATLFWSNEDLEAGFDSPAAAAEHFDLYESEVMKLRRGTELPDPIWIANRVIAVDEDGDAEQAEVVAFADKADAEACWSTSLAEARATNRKRLERPEDGR